MIVSQIAVTTLRTIYCPHAKKYNIVTTKREILSPGDNYYTMMDGVVHPYLLGHGAYDLYYEYNIVVRWFTPIIYFERCSQFMLTKLSNYNGTIITV